MPGAAVLARAGMCPPCACSLVVNLNVNVNILLDISKSDFEDSGDSGPQATNSCGHLVLSSEECGTPAGNYKRVKGRSHKVSYLHLHLHLHCGGTNHLDACGLLCL